MEGNTDLDPTGPRGAPHTPCGGEGRERRVIGEPLSSQKQHSHSACIYWTPAEFTSRGTQTACACVRAHTRTHTHKSKTSFSCWELSAPRRASHQVIIKRTTLCCSLSSAIDFPGFSSYHTWHRPHLHLYQATAFEDAKCNLSRISGSKTLINWNV